MKLIPEQVRNIIEEIKWLQEELIEYKKYIEQKNEESIDGATHLRNNRDSFTETSYSLVTSKFREYSNALSTAELIKRPTTDKIDIGTKFIIKFSDSGELEHLTLVENNIGTSLSEGYISIDSPLGKALIGKKEGDTFEYKVIENITGEIVEIKKDRKDYLEYIRNTSRNSRICKKEKELNKNNSHRNEITNSQKKLLELEVLQLTNEAKLKGDSNHHIQLRLGEIKKQLIESKIVTPPTDNTIGIGSSFSIMIFDNEETIFKRVEMINNAVGIELESDYIEKISLLGSNLIGMKENENFLIRGSNNSITGVVYDIDNSSLLKTNDPTKYQMIKRR